jgi:FAD/FMN-containing dehydrogenase
MNRRNLLKRLAALPFFSVLWGQGGALEAAGRSKKVLRRVRPSDPSWPAATDWEGLKRQVGGRLLQAQSPLAACRSAADAASCAEVLKDYQNPYYIGDQPGATQSSGWVDAWTTAASTYTVAAKETADVVAAVNFARVHNLRLVVKGGGHSYQGTSNAADSLLIWTRAMNQITMHDAFVPQGCAGKLTPQPAVSIGAGAVWMDAYDVVTTKGGRYVQGGGCATVGVAGLIQSGGFGSQSKHYGMAAAALLEAEVVTADGVARIANACMHPDLFWGLKGGGGGSLGVVTRVTLRMRELPEFFGGALMTIEATSDEAFHRLIVRFVDFYAETLMNPHWGESVSFDEHTLSIKMVSNGLDQAAAQKIWQPFLEWLAQSPQDFKLASEPIVRALPARHWWDAEFTKKYLPQRVRLDTRPGAPENHAWWAGDSGQIAIFWDGYESLWMPGKLLEKDQRPRLVEALFKASQCWDVELHFNKGLAGAPEEEIRAARDTATNPAVLEAFALAIIAGGKGQCFPGLAGHEPDLAGARKNASQIAAAMAELRRIVPTPGSYVSESNFFEESWQQSFWGSNYPRLMKVKAKYDPDGLFFVHHGVGSEQWSDDGFTRS